MLLDARIPKFMPKFMPKLNSEIYAEIKIFLASRMFFLKNLTMKHIYRFILHRLCPCSFAFLPFVLQAKKIEVTFDAQAYYTPANNDAGIKEEAKWKSFIIDLCKKLGTFPDYKDGDVFSLTVKNGHIFSQKPDFDIQKHLTKEWKPGDDTAKILSRIHFIEVDTKTFSTSSLKDVFLWTRFLELPNAECISGFSNRLTRDFDMPEVKKILKSKKEEVIPVLFSVFAPKVRSIGNAAFFNFRSLQRFNAQSESESFRDTKPTIVCANLPEGYFEHEQPPEEAVISPVKIKERRTLQGNIENKYEGETVDIGAFAFFKCTKLEHVSVHTSFIGTGAFAGSGVKSAHVLLSRPPTYKSPTIGNDVFSHCFLLRECFIMGGEKERITLDAPTERTFGNCFSLEALSMPNVDACEDLVQGFGVKPEHYYTDSLSMCMNCFNLKVVDLRSFSKGLDKVLPYWLVRYNPTRLNNPYSITLISLMHFKPSDDIIKSFDKNVKRYIELCYNEEALQALKKEQPFELFQDVDATKFINFDEKNEEIKTINQKTIYSVPYCGNLKALVIANATGQEKADLVCEVPSSSYGLTGSLYGSERIPSKNSNYFALKRFMKASERFIVKEEEEEEVFFKGINEKKNPFKGKEEEKEEKSKNKMSEEEEEEEEEELKSKMNEEEEEEEEVFSEKDKKKEIQLLNKKTERDDPDSSEG